MILFNKGYVFDYAGLQFQKLGDREFEYWVCLNSNYWVEAEVNGETIFKLRPEKEKPLYDKKGKLNRYGFKWTDNQIKEYYKL